MAKEVGGWWELDWSSQLLLVVLCGVDFLGEYDVARCKRPTIYCAVHFWTVWWLLLPVFLFCFVLISTTRVWYGYEFLVTRDVYYSVL